MAESSPSRNPAPKRVQEFQAVILTESCDGDGLYPLTERTPLSAAGSTTLLWAAEWAW